MKRGWGVGRVKEGRDSRDGTAIITDLLEEISTTQTGCLHHIEMIDSRGEGEQRGLCRDGAGWVLGGGLLWWRVGGGAQQLAPHLAAPSLHIHCHTSSTLPSGLGWHTAGVEFGDRGQIKGLINTPV